MIIVNLTDGIGNQLFQYSIGLKISILKNSKLLLSTYSYQNNYLRKYSLDKLNISGSMATPEIINFYKEKYLLTEQKEFIYNDKLFENVENNVFIQGYWQCPKYFSDIRPQLLKEFSLKNEIEAKYLQSLNTITNQTNTVSLHIRRGDYATNPKTRYLHGVLPISYYKDAINYFSKKYGKPKLFIFTDDIFWVKKNLILEIEYNIVSLNRNNKNDIQELILMSKCNHHIIANSTFSWWGAWLNTSNKKIVIAPKLWHLRDYMPVIDLYPNNWITIDNYLQS